MTSSAEEIPFSLRSLPGREFVYVAPTIWRSWKVLLNGQPLSCNEGLLWFDDAELGKVKIRISKRLDPTAPTFTYQGESATPVRPRNPLLVLWAALPAPLIVVGFAGGIIGAILGFVIGYIACVLNFRLLRLLPTPKALLVTVLVTAGSTAIWFNASFSFVMLSTPLFPPPPTELTWVSQFHPVTLTYPQSWSLISDPRDRKNELYVALVDASDGASYLIKVEDDPTVAEINLEEFYTRTTEVMLAEHESNALVQESAVTLHDTTFRRLRFDVWNERGKSRMCVDGLYLRAGHVFVSIVWSFPYEGNLEAGSKPPQKILQLDRAAKVFQVDTGL